MRDAASYERAFPPGSLPIRGEELPAWIEKDFDRRALLPRLGVLVILLAGALAEYGHGHREGHWFVLVGYGIATLAAAAGTRSRSEHVARLLPLAATCVDALIAIYVIADHLPHTAGSESRLATDAVSRLPAFLFLLQTGFRLRPGLVFAYSGLVTVGWAASVLAETGLTRELQQHAAFLMRELVGVIAFVTASGFVLYASSWMRRAAVSTLRAWQERLILSRFLPSGVASRVVRADGTEAVAERHATLLSVDLRGSSSLARSHSAADLVKWLLSFRALVHDAVTANGGIIDKYIGDGVLALFLAGNGPQQAANAMAAVQAIFASLTELNGQREVKGVPKLRIIVAIHCGDVLAGVFDDGRRAEFTVLGPCMNDLSRIERRAKEADCDAVVSADVAAMLDASQREDMALRKLSPPTQAASLPELFNIVSLSDATSSSRDGQVSTSGTPTPTRLAS